MAGSRQRTAEQPQGRVGSWVQAHRPQKAQRIRCCDSAGVHRTSPHRDKAETGPSAEGQVGVQVPGLRSSMRLSPSEGRPRGSGGQQGQALGGRGARVGRAGRPAGSYQGGGDAWVEAQQAHVVLHAAGYHQPALPARPPHQLPVDCEDRGSVWGPPAGGPARLLQPRARPRPPRRFQSPGPSPGTTPPNPSAASAPPTWRASPGPRTLWPMRAPRAAQRAREARACLTPRAA